MDFLVDLWLPIVLSAVGVFVVSSVLHMVLPLHRSDFQKLQGEEGVLAGLREHGVKPGEYMFPCAESMKDMGTPEYTEKCNLGPVGYMMILPNGPWNIGKSLLHWFLFSLVMSVLTAYVADFSLARGASFSSVLRLAGTVATIGYAMGAVPNSIWKGVRWSVTMKFVFDGLLYGLTTGAVFGWMWPDLIG